MSLIDNKPTWVKLLLFTLFNITVVSIVFWTLFAYPKISSIDKIEITKIEKGSIHSFSSVLVNNNNFFSINGEDLNFEMEYENTTIGNGEIKGEFFLPANKTSSLSANMKFNIAKLSNFWKNFIILDSLPINVISNGTYTFLNLSIKHEEEMYLSSKDLISIMIADAFGDESIKISNLSIKKAGFSNWVWNFDFKIKNTLPSDIVLHDLTVKVYPDEKTKKELGTWRTNEKDIVLKKNANKTLKGALNISFEGLLKTLLTKAKSKKITTLYVKTTIVVELDNQKFTIPYTNHVSFNPITQEIEITD